MTTFDLGNFISEHVKKHNINIKRLCENTGISRSTFYTLKNGERKEPNLSTITSVARHLKIHPLILMRQLFHGWEFDAKQANTKYPRDCTGFVQDITIPDNSAVFVNSTFVKTWEIQNTGRVAWKKRSLVCVDADLEVTTTCNAKFSTPNSQRGLKPTIREISMPPIQPGEKVRLSVQYTAPAYPCTVVSFWKMVDQSGNYCFPENEGLFCQVCVVGF